MTQKTFTKILSKKITNMNQVEKVRRELCGLVLNVINEEMDGYPMYDRDKDQFDMVMKQLEEAMK